MDILAMLIVVELVMVVVGEAGMTMFAGFGGCVGCGEGFGLGGEAGAVPPLAEEGTEGGETDAYYPVVSEDG